MRDDDIKTDPGTDPLAEIVRAAGRRAAPPQAHYDQVFAAAHKVWRDKVDARPDRRWFAVAASIAVLIGSGMLIYWTQAENPALAATVAVAHGSVEYRLPNSERWESVAGSGFEINAGSRIRTTADGRIALNLDGGGSLRLDANSRIVFGDDAIELAAGRLYFDSDGRPQAQAVRIDTAFGAVRDIGTQFELSLGIDNLTIRVREGEVAVLDSRGVTDLVAALGEELELSANGRLARGSIAPDAAAWGWAAALASVPRAQSVSTYLRWIARETGKRIEWESYAVELDAQRTSFNGDPEGLSPLSLLSSIAATSDFDYRLTDDGAIWIGRN